MTIPPGISGVSDPHSVAAAGLIPVAGAGAAVGPFADLLHFQIGATPPALPAATRAGEILPRVATPIPTPTSVPSTTASVTRFNAPDMDVVSHVPGQVLQAETSGDPATQEGRLLPKDSFPVNSAPTPRVVGSSVSSARPPAIPVTGSAVGSNAQSSLTSIRIPRDVIRTALQTPAPRLVPEASLSPTLPEADLALNATLTPNREAVVFPPSSGELPVPERTPRGPVGLAPSRPWSSPAQLVGAVEDSAVQVAPATPEGLLPASSAKPATSIRTDEAGTSGKAEVGVPSAIQGRDSEVLRSKGTQSRSTDIERSWVSTQPMSVDSQSPIRAEPPADSPQTASRALKHAIGSSSPITAALATVGAPRVAVAPASISGTVESTAAAVRASSSGTFGVESNGPTAGDSLPAASVSPRSNPDSMGSARSKSAPTMAIPRTPAELSRVPKETVPVVPDSRPQPHEVPSSPLDTATLMAAAGWVPTLSTPPVVVTQTQEPVANDELLDLGHGGGAGSHSRSANLPILGDSAPIAPFVSESIPSPGPRTPSPISATPSRSRGSGPEAALSVLGAALPAPETVTPQGGPKGAVALPGWTPVEPTPVSPAFSETSARASTPDPAPEGEVAAMAEQVGIRFERVQSLAVPTATAEWTTLQPAGDSSLVTETTDYPAGPLNAVPTEPQRAAAPVRLESRQPVAAPGVANPQANLSSESKPAIERKPVSNAQQPVREEGTRPQSEWTRDAELPAVARPGVGTAVHSTPEIAPVSVSSSLVESEVPAGPMEASIKSRSEINDGVTSQPKSSTLSVPFSNAEPTIHEARTRPQSTMVIGAELPAPPQPGVRSGVRSAPEIAPVSVSSSLVEPEVPAGPMETRIESRPRPERNDGTISQPKSEPVDVSTPNSPLRVEVAPPKSSTFSVPFSNAGPTIHEAGTRPQSEWTRVAELPAAPQPGVSSAFRSAPEIAPVSVSSSLVESEVPAGPMGASIKSRSEINDGVTSQPKSSTLSVPFSNAGPTIHEAGTRPQSDWTRDAELPAAPQPGVSSAFRSAPEIAPVSVSSSQVQPEVPAGPMGASIKSRSEINDGVTSQPKSSTLSVPFSNAGPTIHEAGTRPQSEWTRDAELPAVARPGVGTAVHSTPEIAPVSVSSSQVQPEVPAGPMETRIESRPERNDGTTSQPKSEPVEVSTPNSPVRVEVLPTKSSTLTVPFSNAGPTIHEAGTRPQSDWTRDADLSAAPQPGVPSAFRSAPEIAPDSVSSSQVDPEVSAGPREARIESRPEINDGTTSLPKPESSVRAEGLPTKPSTLPVPFSTTDSPVRPPDRAPQEEPKTEPGSEPRTWESRGQPPSIPTPGPTPFPVESAAVVSESSPVSSFVGSTDSDSVKASVSGPGREVRLTDEAAPRPAEFRAHRESSVSIEASPTSVAPLKPFGESAEPFTSDQPRVSTDLLQRRDRVESGTQDPVVAREDLSSKTETPEAFAESRASVPGPFASSAPTAVFPAVESRSRHPNVPSLSQPVTPQSADHPQVASESRVRPAALPRTVSGEQAPMASPLPRIPAAEPAFPVAPEKSVEPDGLAEPRLLPRADAAPRLVEVVRKPAEAPSEQPSVSLEVNEFPVSKGTSAPEASIPLIRGSEPPETTVDAPHLDRTELRGPAIGSVTAVPVVRLQTPVPVASEPSEIVHPTGTPKTPVVEENPAGENLSRWVESQARPQEVRLASGSRHPTDAAVTTFTGATQEARSTSVVERGQSVAMSVPVPVASPEATISAAVRPPEKQTAADLGPTPSLRAQAQPTFKPDSSAVGGTVNERPAVLVNSAPRPTEARTQDEVNQPTAGVNERVRVEPKDTSTRTEGQGVSVTRTATARAKGPDASIPSSDSVVEHSMPELPQGVPTRRSPDTSSEALPAEVRSSFESSTRESRNTSAIPIEPFPNPIGGRPPSMPDRSASTASIPGSSVTISTLQSSAVPPENLNSNPAPTRVDPIFVREPRSLESARPAATAMIPGQVFDNTVRMDRSAQTSVTRIPVERQESLAVLDASSASMVDAEAATIEGTVDAERSPKVEHRSGAQAPILTPQKEALNSNSLAAFVGTGEVPGKVDTAAASPLTSKSISGTEVPLQSRSHSLQARPDSQTGSEIGYDRVDSANLVDPQSQTSRAEVWRATALEFGPRAEVSPKVGDEAPAQPNASASFPEPNSEPREAHVPSDRMNPGTAAPAMSAPTVPLAPVLASIPAALGLAMGSPSSRRAVEPASVRMQSDRSVPSDTAVSIEARPSLVPAGIGSASDSLAGMANGESGQRGREETPRQTREVAAPLATVPHTAAGPQPGLDRASVKSESPTLSSAQPQTTSIAPVNHPAAPAALETRPGFVKATHSRHSLETRELELGTPAASMVGTMAHEPTADNIAGTGTQALPGDATHRGSSPVGLERSLTPMVTPDSAAILPSSRLEAPLQAEAAAATHRAGLYESVDRLQSMMATHASSVMVGHVDELRAVLRPDSGTEIHLHVRREADRVEMTAHCQGGDAAALQSSWGDLQQRLRSQGVSLQALEVGTRSSNSGMGAGSDPERQRPQSQNLSADERESDRRGSSAGRRSQGDPAAQQESVARRPARRVTPRVAEYWA